MANSRCSSRNSVCSQPQRPPSIAEPPPPPPPPLQDDPNDGRGDEIQPCPAGYLANHPMAHTPPPPPPPDEETQQEVPEVRSSVYSQPVMGKPAKERRLPSRSGSAASLFASQFASLSRRLGAKHKAAKSAMGSTGSGSRNSTPIEFPLPSGSSGVGPSGSSRSTTPASSSMYSTFPRLHSSSSSSTTTTANHTPSPSGRTPFINQLLMGHSQSQQSASSSTAIYQATSCPSCPSPSCSSSSIPPPMMTEVLDEPVEEEGAAGERVTWEYHHVTMNRVPGFGFGIAVSGGRDNPHFANGDPSIAISDVIKGGPAEGKLLTNDRVLSVNGVSLENVDYATAVSVLRDSGASVNLVVKRRIVLSAYQEPPTYKVTLTKSKKKDDFGVILGSRLYLKELTNRALIERENLNGNSPVFQEGDIVLKINSTPTEGLSLKDARKLMENCKDKLQLTIRRANTYDIAVGSSASSSQPALGAVGGVGGPPSLPGQYDPTYAGASVGKEAAVNHFHSNSGNYSDRPNYCNQNLYVQPPTRGGSVDYRNPLTPPPAMPNGPSGVQQPGYEDKTNISRLTGRSRGPLMDVSLSQLDSHHHMNGHNGGPEGEDAPPRPPPPRTEDFYGSRPEPHKPPPTLDPRFISFQKEGSVGIRVTGGNQVGIFVTAVQPGSPAALQGLVPGDKILKVNDMEMDGVTREEAVLFLLSLQDQIELVVQHKREEYDQVVASGHGDSFYVKTHFNYEQPASGHMSFRKGEVFHVVDTLYKGVVGAWQAFRVGPNGQDLQQGVVPNSAAAEELATAQFNAAKKEAATTTSESRGSFFRRRRPTHRRSKSLGRDHWDDVVFAETLSKFPAYERVVLRHPGFIRPVVFFGPIADIAREKLIKDFPDKFSSPQIDGSSRDAPDAASTGSGVTPAASGRSGIVRLSSIRELVEKGRHALLDITPGAVDKLNYAQFYPVVIFLRADSKHTVKELRAGTPKTAHKSSKKLYEQSVKLEKLWSHIFTTVVPLTQRDTWYRKLREAIDREQNQAIWVSEAKLDEYLSDDFLFPMTSRLSYASSPESDLDLSPEPRPSGSSNSASGKNGLNGVSNGKTPSSPASGRLVKSSSDPSIATQDDLGLGTSLSPNGHLGHNMSPVPKFLQQSHHSGMDASTPSKRRSQGGDSKYGFSPSGNGHVPQQSQQQHPSHHQPRDSVTPLSPRTNGPGPAYPYSSPSSRSNHHPPPVSTNLDYINGQQHPPHQRSMGPSSGSNGYPPSSQHHYPSYSQYGGNSNGHGNGLGTELPPKIDRSIKPSTSSGRLPRSAQERLFGSREGDLNGVGMDSYPTSPPGPAPSHQQLAHVNGHQDYMGSLRNSSLDRDRAAKAASYDSSSSYESYNRLGLTLSLPAGHHNLNGDPSNCGIPGSPGHHGGGHNGSMSKTSMHDPYRYTRSTSQPVRTPTEPASPASKQHRSKPSPPPKTAATSSAPYKPVPPPKPKNYRPPPNATNSAVSSSSSSATNQQTPATPNSNYWNHSPPGTLTHSGHHGQQPQQQQGYYSHGQPANGHINGHKSYRYEDDANGGFDSGHGSSLDRHSYGGTNSLYGKAPPPPPPANNGPSSRSNGHQAGQYYYNVPPPRDQQQRGDGGRLDLAQHRDQRGSAFELYKKPIDPRSPSHGHQLYMMEHNARLDYDYFDGEGDIGPPVSSDYYQHYHDYYSPPTSPPPANCTVIATVRGWLTHDRGGRLESVETGVALLVPPGALPPAPESHLVYFKVCRQESRPAAEAIYSNGSMIDQGKGEALLSPLVQCGPKGLRFLKPVELRIPHAGGGSRPGRPGSDRWNVSLKASNEMGQWRQIDLPRRHGGDDPRALLDNEDPDYDADDAKNSRHHLSVFVDHF